MAEIVNFTDRLLAAIEQKKTPLLVGIDPVYDQLPAFITRHRELNDEDDVQASTDALIEFSNRIIKVIAPHVAAVKINSAFFERYFWEGLEAYSAVVQEASANGLIVIGDVKRSDIGNTSKHYAAATLAEPSFTNMDTIINPDAVTVNPYLGSEGVKPFIDVAAEEGKGVFVLVRTSNKDAAEIQEFKNAEGLPLYMHIGKLVEKWGSGLIGHRGYSAIGAVVGATNAQQLLELRQALPSTFFLVPGYGAQGGTAEDVAKAFKADGTGAIINASRSILYAYKDPKYAAVGKDNWEKAVEQAVLATKQEINQALGR